MCGRCLILNSQLCKYGLWLLSCTTCGVVIHGALQLEIANSSLVMSHFLISFVYVSLFLIPVLQCAEVYVDSTLGSDADCLSLPDLQFQEESSASGSGDNVNNVFFGLDPPCRSINHALGNVDCNARSCNNPNPLRNAVLRLSNGVHTLGRCAAILRSENVTLEAENPGQATIRCTELGNTRDFDNIFVCLTNGLTFRGINFEGCGPLSSNVFINRSTDVLFEDCTFE